MAAAFVSLPMYALAEVASETERLGRALAENLTASGLDAEWENPDLPDHKALEKHWLDPRLLLSQACALPLIESLHRVRPVGTWAWKDIAEDGTYRSVIVARKPLGRASLRPVVNGVHSLSGWASLGSFLSAWGGEVRPSLTSGSHAASLQALQDCRADIAAIDAVSWQLLSRHRPRAVAGLELVGEGPPIPCLPLITAETRSEFVPELRTAAECAARSAEALGIVGFLPQEDEAFASVAALVPVARQVLGRFHEK